MRTRRSRLNLTQKFALLSLVPMLALGLVLYGVLRQQIVQRTLEDAGEAAGLIARLGIQPRLTPADLEHGLSAQGVRSLDTQLQARSTTQDLARIKVWNTHHQIVYSDDHALIGRTLPEDDDLREALAGSPQAAEVVTPSLHSETASEVGLGRLVEVYVPMRFSPSEPPAGVFEIYLSYAPLAASLARDERIIALVIFCGLALLWAALFKIVSGATSRLRRQAQENDLLARYDQLTGLPNRTLFIERVTQALQDERPQPSTEHPQRRLGHSQHESVAVLLLDLDGFKEINDTLGNHNGDIVLREVASRLLGVASHIDAQVSVKIFAARLGGDEYAVLCTHIVDTSTAMEVAALVHASLERPVLLEDVALNIDASIGVALASEPGDDVSSLCQRADVALNRARSHRSRVEVYSSEYDHFDATKLVLLGQVRDALEEDQFRLHYQPKAELDTGRITGVEALLRWQHPERGLLGPMEFIPLIEQTSLVGPVSLYVIDCALEQLMRWKDQDIHLEMSVNLSARNLLDPELPNQIESLLRRHNVVGNKLTVEVTESATMFKSRARRSCAAGAESIGCGDLDRRLRHRPCIDRVSHEAARE